MLSVYTPFNSQLIEFWKPMKTKHVLIIVTLFLSSSGITMNHSSAAEPGTELWTAYTAKKAKPMNPALSANMLGLFQRGTDLSSNRSDQPRNGLRIQEMELQLSSDIDPYIRGSALLSVHQEHDGTEYEVEPEELYIETISLPSVTLRAGKMRLALGKHNQLHTHAYPFIDAPLTQSDFVGDEGLNEFAVSAAWLAPLPWFSELTLQFFDPSNDEIFNSTRTGDLGALVRARNLWDLNDTLTFELGLSGAQARNDTGLNSSALSSDFTFKWRPNEQSRSKSFTWSTEWMLTNRRGKTDSDSGLDTSKLSAVSSWIQYQMTERWWIQGRVEQAGIFNRSEGNVGKRKNSALIGFFPTEFSGFRAQYDRLAEYGAEDEHRFSIQFNISMGAHPAHAY